MRPFPLVVLIAIWIGLGWAPSLAPASAAEEPRRVALVVGNAVYERGRFLRNTANDAADIAAILKKLNFKLVGDRAQINLSRIAMLRAIRDFRAALKPGDIALFYFAGHGAQFNNLNYLIPTDDRDVGAREDVPDLAIGAENLLRQLEELQTTNLIILDACRDSPLPSRVPEYRGLPRGLADRPTTRGSYMAFAAAPGEEASDGDGRNGLFTGELLKAIQIPGLDVDQMFRRVRQNVVERSHGEQTPWSQGSLTGDLVLMPLPPEVPKATLVTLPLSPDVTVDDREAKLWSAIKDSKMADDFAVYLKRYPNGVYAGLAEARLAMMTKQQASEKQAGEKQAGEKQAGEKPTFEASLDARERRVIQEQLIRLGFYSGTVHSEFGPAFRSAVKLDQAFRGLPQTGTLTVDQRKAIGAAAKRLDELLAKAPRSPRGVAASTVTVADDRYRKAWSHESGTGGATKDPAEAAYWYRLAASDGHVTSLVNLGTLYARGLGVTQDSEAATILWSAAAARKDPNALFNLGILYERGVGLAADRATALRFYHRAAELKSADASAALKRLDLDRTASR